MTTVTFFKSEIYGLIGFEAAGHTDFADEGEDIVCAAVSALTQSVMDGLIKVVKAPVMYEVDEENAYLTVCLTSECDTDTLRDSQILLETLRESIEGIAFNYPEYVRMNYQERRKFTCSA